MKYPPINMMLNQIFLGQVPDELVSDITTQATYVGLNKGAHVAGGSCSLSGDTRTAVFTFLAFYYGEVLVAPVEGEWSSQPTLQAQGELFAACDTPPLYGCVPPGWLCWPSVGCSIILAQTVFAGGQEIGVSWPKQTTLLDTSGSLAKREYLPPEVEPSSARFEADQGWIEIAIAVRIEAPLKDGYLYFSPRCDSERFQINFPTSFMVPHVSI